MKQLMTSFWNMIPVSTDMYLNKTIAILFCSSFNIFFSNKKDTYHTCRFLLLIIIINSLAFNIVSQINQNTLCSL